MEEFITKDLPIVSYLLAIGFKFRRPPAQDQNHDHINFYFSKTEALEKACRDYHDHRARVDPIILLEKNRSMKSLIWSIRKGLYEDQNTSKDEGDQENGKTPNP